MKLTDPQSMPSILPGVLFPLGGLYGGGGMPHGVIGKTVSAGMVPSGADQGVAVLQDGDHIGCPHYTLKQMVFWPVSSRMITLYIVRRQLPGNVSLKSPPLKALLVMNLVRCKKL